MNLEVIALVVAIITGVMAILGASYKMLRLIIHISNMVESAEHLVRSLTEAHKDMHDDIEQLKVDAGMHDRTNKEDCPICSLDKEDKKIW